MGRKKPLIDSEGELRELSREEVRAMRPAHEVLPPEVLRRLPGQRGPQKAPTKVPVSLRLSRHVLQQFKEGGPGWQGRIDRALAQWLAEHREER